MSQHKREFLERLSREPAVLVRVDSTEGSVPREAGTWMAVFADAVVGTIGGGHLEYEAISRAKSHLQGDGCEQFVRVVLGPSLGQCCGGVVGLRYEKVGPGDVPLLQSGLNGHLQAVALFGGGHVGHALVQVLSRLPFALSWFDSRDGIFSDAEQGFSAGQPQGKMNPLGGQSATRSEQAWGPNITCEHSDPVQTAVRYLEPDSQVLIMSFSHAEDLDIVAACLDRQRERADLPFIGLIGSKTKWATFRHRLTARGYSEEELAQVTCPIGLPDVVGKEPEVIAVSVAAQLLTRSRR
ncbi:MAG TPA: xanthine dehydrogenase accessory protein XdhC [Polaromonas sp.]|uniref:xanthine dehydrogenase accessory protein XdhC n=1 Tax=Polaromonas sp. TaxID=1869339 RepID=UPI002D6A0C5E|nr:xanthine dehydrogenase accessory protein XdhC [Polaromonas sp.]HYW58352.1 xanthine dehydrogenase accessory protein XdhC [Polaromonas sp.]